LFLFRIPGRFWKIQVLFLYPAAAVSGQADTAAAADAADGRIEELFSGC